MDRYRSPLDNPEFMSRLPDHIAEGLKSTRDEKPTTLDLNPNIYKDARVPMKDWLGILIITLLLCDQLHKQQGHLLSAIKCFKKNSSGEVDFESFRAAIKAATQVGMLVQETNQNFKLGPYLCKAISAREHYKRTLNLLNDRREAKANERWAPWRCLYRQGIEELDYSPNDAVTEIAGLMPHFGFLNPATNEPYSMRTIWKQLRKKPAVDWMPN